MEEPLSEADSRTASLARKRARDNEEEAALSRSSVDDDSEEGYSPSLSMQTDGVEEPYLHLANFSNGYNALAQGALYPESNSIHKHDTEDPALGNSGDASNFTSHETYNDLISDNDSTTSPGLGVGRESLQEGSDRKKRKGGLQLPQHASSKEVSRIQDSERRLAATICSPLAQQVVDEACRNGYGLVIQAAFSRKKTSGKRPNVAMRRRMLSLVVENAFDDILSCQACIHTDQGESYIRCALIYAGVSPTLKAREILEGQKFDEYDSHVEIPPANATVKIGTREVKDTSQTIYNARMKRILDLVDRGKLSSSSYAYFNANRQKQHLDLIAKLCSPSAAVELPSNGPEEKTEPMNAEEDGWARHGQASHPIPVDNNTDSDSPDERQAEPTTDPREQAFTVILSQLPDSEQVLQKRYWGITSPSAAPRCNLCGRLGHASDTCSTRICRHCFARDDHFSRGCPSAPPVSPPPSSPPPNTAVPTCTLCPSLAHTAPDCPTIWTTHHITDLRVIADGTAPEPYKVPSLRTFCYNCGRANHWGDDCPFPRPAPPSLSRRNLYSSITAAISTAGQRPGESPFSAAQAAAYLTQPAPPAPADPEELRAAERYAREPASFVPPPPRTRPKGGSGGFAIRGRAAHIPAPRDLSSDDGDVDTFLRRGRGGGSRGRGGGRGRGGVAGGGKPVMSVRINKGGNLAARGGGAVGGSGGGDGGPRRGRQGGRGGGSGGGGAGGGARSRSPVRRREADYRERERDRDRDGRRDGGGGSGGGGGGGGGKNGYGGGGNAGGSRGRGGGGGGGGRRWGGRR